MHCMVHVLALSYGFLRTNLLNSIRIVKDQPSKLFNMKCILLDVQCFTMRNIRMPDCVCVFIISLKISHSYILPYQVHVLYCQVLLILSVLISKVNFVYYA